MALRSLLSKYKSISRPSVFSGGSSSYSSLAKKQVSAEDAIIDNQYETGNLSAESYLSYLTIRAARSWNTPLQVQNLREKISTVQTSVVDASYDRAFQSGELDARDLYAYEKSKLDKMSSPGSAAYIKQEQKVQGLLDKAEKSERADYRRSYLLELSQMPEDTSEKLWQKVNLYEQLENQARLDGDFDEADSIATQKNNYMSSAKRADINDLITGTRLQTSQTMGAGLGVPSSESGSKLYGELTGSTGFSGYQSPAVSNALESLDRQKNTLDRLYQSRSDKELMIDTYKKAVDAATGDQKTQLTIALNNLIEDVNSIDNQISNTTQNVYDTVYKIQELNQKASAASFNQEVRKTNSEFGKVEDELETEFKKGKIDKYEYVSKGIELAQTKAMYYDQVSGVYSQYGNDASADSYLEKTNQAIEIHESLIGIGQNIDDYEPIFVDKESNLTNIYGERLNKGDVVLQDVRQIKDAGNWDVNYAKVDNVYHRIYYGELPEEFVDNNGFAISGLMNDKNLASYMGNAFVYTIKDGRVEQEKINFVSSDEGTEAMTETRINKLMEDGAVIKNQQGKLIWKPEMKESPFLKAAAGVQEFAEKNVPGLKQLGETLRGEGSKNVYSPIQDWTKSPISSISDYIKPLAEKGIEGAKNIFEKGKEFAGKAINTVKDTFRRMNIFNPPEVSGDETGKSVDQIIDETAEKYAPGDEQFRQVLHAIALAESNKDPNAIGDNGRSVGLYQNNMANGRGKGYTVDQLKDPNFNADLSARELIKYYNQGVQKGLSGEKLTAYVSKYGQRPAPGNELNAAQKFLEYVGSGFKSIFSKEEPKDYTDYSSLTDPKRNRNIELALGIDSGQYRKGLQQDQAAIDRAFRSDEQTQKLMREEGFAPSWETPQPSSSPSPTPMPQSSGGGSSWSMPRIDIPSAVNKATSSVKSYFNPTSNQGKNFWSTPVASGLANIQSSIQKVTQPVVNRVSTAVNNVKNFVSNLFKKK